jgi:hypothetical protein
MNVRADIKRRKTPTMEYTTLTIETTSPGQGIPAKPHRLWIEQQEMPVEQHSLAQWLEEMSRQGWKSTRSRAMPNPTGTLCEFHFQRPVAGNL